MTGTEKVVSAWIPGGPSAPGRARRFVAGVLEARVPAAIRSDLALVTSELVTNSVRHAQVGEESGVTLEVSRAGSVIALAVTDPGSREEPRIRDHVAGHLGGFGLRLVNELCADWGFTRGEGGTMRVWCELLTQSPRRTAGSGHRTAPEPARGLAVARRSG